MNELWRYDTVPKLKEAYESVAGSLQYTQDDPQNNNKSKL